MSNLNGAGLLKIDFLTQSKLYYRTICARKCAKKTLKVT